MKNKTFILLLTITLSVSAQAQWTKFTIDYTPSRHVHNISSASKDVFWGMLMNDDLDFTNEYIKTIDGGETWESGVLPIPSPLTTNSIFALNENMAWVSTFNGVNGGGAIYATTDGGATWVHQNTALYAAPEGFPNVVYFFDENRGVTIGDPQNGYFEIYTTTDGGNNWNRVAQSNIPAPLSNEYGWNDDYEVANNRIWFITDQGRVYRSLDFGATWSVSSTPLSSTDNIAFIDSSYGIVEYDDTYVYTDDGGDTWHSLSIPLSFRSLAALPGSDHFLATEWGELGTVISEDRGVTWQQHESQTAITRMDFIDRCTGWGGGIYDSPSNNKVVVYKWNEIDLSVDQTEEELESNYYFGDYQWINCDNGEPIPGATSRTYTATSNGNYAAVVTTISGCSDTTECKLVSTIDTSTVDTTTTGVHNLFQNAFVEIYPNPVEQLLQAKIKSEEIIEMKVEDVNGRVVFSNKVTEGKLEYTLDLSSLESGIYLFSVKTVLGEMDYRRLIKL